MASSSVGNSSRTTIASRLAAAVPLSEHLLSLDGVTKDQLVTLTGFATWVVEELDYQKNEISNPGAWADLVVFLGKASFCKQSIHGVALMPHFRDLGILSFAPNCSLGMKDIVDFRGTEESKSKAADMLSLRALITNNDLVTKFPWLQSVLYDIQTLHLDLTGEWDADMM